MVNIDQLIQLDLKHVWHPCTQMKDFEKFPPVVVHEARGSYLYTDRGPVIDAISSWWCKSLGHGHPAITSAITEQLASFEHVMGANFTYPKRAELAERLALLSGLQHIFFASDGSSAVEIAMKLALHSSKLKGYKTRNKFIALKNSYHGETLATLSVSDLGLYKKPYDSLQFDCHFLQNIPYISNSNEDLWHSCNAYWPLIEQELDTVKNDVCAIIVEPIVQGAGGMQCYSADFLRKLAVWAKQNAVYLIADEIMTGIGRTGKWLAIHHAGIKPDMICLSKGLTSGTVPMSCVLVDDEIYNLFYHDAKEGKSFLHSHTYSGNPLAVSAALATIKTIESEGINEQAEALGIYMHQYFSDIATVSGKISNIRFIGAMVAGNLEPIEGRRVGFELRQEGLSRGALLRPLGNTLYWLPPLTTDQETIEKLAEITLNSIKAVYS